MHFRQAQQCISQGKVIYFIIQRIRISNFLILIFSPPQMSRIQNRGDPSTYALAYSHKIFGRVSSYKALGIIFSENLT